jgi:hypothetical protein
MAIVFANLGASANPDINSSTDASSYASLSWTPPTAGLLIVAVHSRGNGVPAAQPTLSGNGLTFTQIDSVIRTNDQLTLFGANLAGATAGITTVDFGGALQLNCTVSFFYATGVDLSGGVSAAFVQSATAGSGVTTSGSVILAAASNTQNRPLAFFWHEGNEGATERTNWTKADDMHGSGTVRSLMTQYRPDAFETTASASWTTASAWRVIAAEIKALVNNFTLTAGTGTYTLSGKAVTLTYTASVVVTVSGTALLTSAYHTSVSHVSTADLIYGNATARTRAENAMAPALEFHRVSAHSYGTNDPWVWDGTGTRPADPTNWGNLDNYMASIARMGGTPIIGFGNWSWHIKGKWDGTNTVPMTFAEQLDDTGRPITEKLPDALHFVQRVCERYMVAPYNVRWWQLGSWEFHGFYRNRDGSLNGLWGYDAYAGTPGQADMGMAYLHNQVAAKIIATAASLSTPIPRNQLKIITNYTPCMANGGTSGAYPVGHPLRNRPWGSALKARPDSLLAHLPLLTPGSWDYWSYDISSHHTDDVITTDDWTNAQLFTDIGQYLNDQVAAIGYGSMPFIISEEYNKPQLDPGTNQFVLRAAMHADAFMRFIKLGASMAIIWSTVGRANNPGADEEAGLHSAVGTSTGGQPQPPLDIVQMIHDNFSAGTVIRSSSASDTGKASVLANPSAAMVINHLANPLKVSVNGGTPQTLAAYETRLVTFATAYTLTADTGTYTLSGKAVNFKVGHRLVAATATYTLTGKAITFLRGLRLVATAGSYTLAGQSVALKVGRRLVAATGTYTLTGNAVTFVHQPPITLLARPGVFVLSGQVANLLVQRKLSLDAGIFALSGQAVALTVVHRLVAAPGTYTLTGQTVNLKVARTLSAVTGAYALSGQDVGLLWAHRLIVSAGSYALSGQTVILVRSLRLFLDTGTYTLSGQDVGLRAARRLAIAQATYILTGKSVNLIYAPLGHFSLLANGGSFALTGQSAGLSVQRRLIASPGAYALTGVDATLSFVRRLTLATGHYTINGKALSFTWSSAPEVPVPAERIHTVEFENRVLEVFE